MNDYKLYQELKLQVQCMYFILGNLGYEMSAEETRLGADEILVNIIVLWYRSLFCIKCILLGMRFRKKFICGLSLNLCFIMYIYVNLL